MTSCDEMTDIELDELLPLEVRRVSGLYWTSVAVARRAALILERLAVRRVLDLGSGPGKFCVAAAVRAPGIEFFGVEHRPQLVDAARLLAAKVGAPNVTFAVGDATQISWADYDAIYAFNSFAENDFEPENQFDRTVELSRARHIAELRRVARRLSLAPVGTVLLTYHGLTGPIPRSYELVHVEAAGCGWLRAWRKESAVEANTFWLEEGSDVTVWAAQPDAQLGGSPSAGAKD